jgi:ATP-dependent DNA helicase RecQ
MLKLRPFQIQALDALADTPSHLLCVAPTGSGKSLIYERMAARPGMRTLLVTPLIALARQQLERFQSSGIAVTSATGRMSSPGDPPERSGAWIVSPESLLSRARQRRLERWSPDFLVVDECHCLWEWGNHFRPAFDLLPDLLRSYGIPRSLWLTATLPGPARKSLRRAFRERDLSLREMGTFSVPAELTLVARRVPWPSRASALIAQVGEWRKIGSGIVFAQSREACERVARLLGAADFPALVYHAGLSREERRNIEAAVRDQAPGSEIVVATSAFGMGMDHAHLRWVLLWQAPPSLLALAQSIGRAGRAPGRPAYATVFWDQEDFRLIDWMAQGSEQRKSDLRAVAGFLRGEECRREALERYFNGDAENRRGRSRSAAPLESPPPF